MRHKEAIGAPLEEARCRLLSLIGRLDDQLGEYAAPLLDEAKRQLDQRTCRIAVVGQVKAGKSTFINALAERPELLPTDVNPWTAVVTSLHFRKSATPPEHAAVFHLFSADEWRGLAEGGGRLRELTERLVPGFQPELLRAQLEVMRKRAERRLGAKFSELLGECHRFEEVTPELLADYVSAGNDYANPAPNGRQRRLYSDITRSAELHFNDSPFAFPITLIDTPGTNDPFLVRDEITRRSLENPDIYVFVISALQPLSVADISMLRLLNGLHKDRIVVFMNRADQLPNPERDASVIKAAVEKRLRSEFPALHIPVIYGSAWLGNLSLQTHRADLHAGLKPAQSAVTPEAGLLARIEANGHQSSAERSRAVAAMNMSSGMREVSAAITKLMCSSRISMLLRQIAACLVELVRSSDVTHKAELKSIEELLEVRRTESTALRAKIAEEQKSLAVFEERANALRSCFQVMEDHFNDLIVSGSQTLRDQLSKIVREFADDEADAMLSSLMDRKGRKTWQCDVAPLRERLEVAYVASIDQVASELARIEKFLYPQLKVIVSKLLPDYRGTLLEAPQWELASAPSVAPLGNKVAMDLDTSWWSRWFALRRAPVERANELRRLIEADFYKIVDELVHEAQQHLRQRVDYTMQRAHAISSGLLNGMEQRNAILAAERALLDGPGDQKSLLRFQSEQEQRATGCAQRQALFAVALEELDGVLQTLEGAQSDTRYQ